MFKVLSPFNPSPFFLAHCLWKLCKDSRRRRLKINAINCVIKSDLINSPFIGSIATFLKIWGATVKRSVKSRHAGPHVTSKNHQWTCWGYFSLPIWEIPQCTEGGNSCLRDKWRQRFMCLLCSVNHVIPVTSEWCKLIHICRVSDDACDFFVFCFAGKWMHEDQDFGRLLLLCLGFTCVLAGTCQELCENGPRHVWSYKVRTEGGCMFLARIRCYCLITSKH